MISFRTLKFMLALVLISITLFADNPTNGYAAEKTAVNVYDNSGRLVNTKLADGTVVEYQYDVNGNLLQKNFNMLMNSGFEIYTGKNGVADSWGNWESAGVKANYHVVTSPVSSGKHAQQMITLNMPKSGVSNFFQDVTVTGGKLYTISSQMEITKLTKAKVIVSVQYFDKNNNLIGEETPFEYSGNTNWLSINEQVKSVTNAVRARLHFNILAVEDNASGTVTVDSVMFQKGELTNLLINPGFETNTRTSGVADGWGNWESAGVKANYRVVTSPVSSGKHAQQMIISNIPKDGMHTFFQDVAVTGGQPYTLSSQIAIANLSKAKVQIFMHYFDVNNNFIGNEIPFEYSGNTDWLSINEQVRPVAKTVRARVHFNIVAIDNNASGTVTVDSVTFQKGEQSNLLINSGFEMNTRTSGVADGWGNWESAGVKANYRVVNSQVSSGKQAQQMVISNIPKDGMHTFFQDVAVTGGQPYSLSSQIAIANLSKAKVQIFMHYFDVNNNFIGNETPFEYSGNTGWLSINEQVRPVAKTVRARLHFNVLAVDNNASGIVKVDSVTFQKGERSNLLINPGFETNTRTSGVADGWGNWESTGVKANYRVVTSPVSSGKHAQQMSISNIPKDGMHTFFQDVAVTGGQPYTLGSQIAITNLSKAKFQVIMHYFDVNNNFIGNETPFEYSDNTSWKSVQVQVKPPANTVRARVHFNLLASEDKASGTVTVDSVIFQRIK